MSALLSKIVERRQYCFRDSVDTWQEAVRLSTLPLVETGYVDEDYYRQIVDCIEKYGPYVVFDHEVAMPHTTENAQGVRRTGVSLMIVREPVSFGPDDEGEEKTARLFFTLAAESPEEHMQNIQNLVGIFTNEDLLAALKDCTTGADILAAEAAWPCQEF